MVFAGNLSAVTNEVSWVAGTLRAILIVVVVGTGAKIVAVPPASFPAPAKEYCVPKTKTLDAPSAGSKVTTMSESSRKRNGIGQVWFPVFVPE